VSGQDSWRILSRPFKINDGPTGRVIAASDEKVWDLLEEFRQKAYEMGLQMRVDAAEVAFFPSE
jgi:hypothetical protein